MEFQWIKGSAASPAVTIYANNLTLNNAAARYFENVRYCLLGIDAHSMAIAIKPVTSRDIDLKIYETSNLNKVSIGKGYARISNKTFIDEINKALEKDTTSLKYEANFDELREMLVVNLIEGEMAL